MLTSSGGALRLAERGGVGDERAATPTPPRAALLSGGAGSGTERGRGGAVPCRMPSSDVSHVGDEETPGCCGAMGRHK